MSKSTIADQVLELLSDGKPHHRDELRALARPSRDRAILRHITLARKMIPEDQEIICRFKKRQLFYQRVVVYQEGKS